MLMRRSGSLTDGQRSRLKCELSGAEGGSGRSRAPPSPRPSARERGIHGHRHHAGVRVGIGYFATLTPSRNRGIGRVSRSLLAALLNRDQHNNYVLYGQDDVPADLIPKAPNAVVRFLRPDAAAGETTVAPALDRLIASNPDSLDVLLLLNPLEMAPCSDLPAHPSNGMKIAAVIYDLIPLLFQENRPSGWPDPEHLMRNVENLSRLGSYDALLAISEATRRDLLSLLGVSPERVVTIGTASDGRFFVPDRSDPMPAESRALFQKLGITGPFVLSVGSMEYQRRDNLWGMIEAFAMLPVELRQAHQLVVTYALSYAGRKRVQQCASDHGIADRLVITDRLGDRAMRALYQRCAAFVSITSYEELGLPILDAMHCGTPVVAGNSAAQMELIGDAGLFFNVTDAAELTHRLVQALTDSARASELRDLAVVQALPFHWDMVADKVIDVLTRTRPVNQADRHAPCADAPHVALLPTVNSKTRIARRAPAEDDRIEQPNSTRGELVARRNSADLGVQRT